jgi:dienelactone hydrolase
MPARFMAALVGLALVLAALPQHAQAALVTREIHYKDGDTALTGYLAYDDATKTPAPGILVAHEWWGYNSYVKSRAEQLAKLGYVAFALDMYGTGVTGNTPAEAGALSKPFYDDRAFMRRRALAGLAVLKAQPQVDGKRLGAIGYCFGGGVVLSLARAGADLKGVVSFHGNLATPEPAKPGTVKAQVLELGGADDKFVSQEEKQAFSKEMQAAGVTYKMIDYPGATHAFTNPAATDIGKAFNLPIAYDRQADEQSWQAMKEFFARLFAGKD